MKTIDNVLKFIKEQQLSVREFEAVAGLGHNTIGKARQRNADLSAENIEKIVEKYSTELRSAGYVIIDLEPVGGQGKAIISRDVELGEPYDTLVLQSISRKSRGDEFHKDNRSIPFYDSEAMAGNNYTADMTPITHPTSTIDIGDMLRDSQAAMRVYGNSMIPGYPPGSVIGLRRNYDGFIEPGTVYVIETKSNRYIKRLFYNDDKTGYLCVSDNEIKYEHGPMQGRYFYPPFEIPFESIQALFDVTGVVKRNKNSAIVMKED